MDRLVSRRKVMAAGAGLALVGISAAKASGAIDLGAIFAKHPGSATQAMTIALERARSERQPIIVPAGRYEIEDDFEIDWDGFTLLGSGQDARFIQKRSDRGFLRLVGDGAKIGGFTFSSVASRPDSKGFFRGYNAFQRNCAVWIEGSNNRVARVWVRDAFVGVCLRGPVVTAAGHKPASNARADHSFIPRARNNRVSMVNGDRVDFVLTGNQQENLIIEDIWSLNTADHGTPPHTIYMQNPASSEPTCGRSVNVTARRLHARGNHAGVAFKFEDVSQLIVDDFETEDTAGGVFVINGDGGRITNGRLNALAADRGRSFPAIGFKRSNRFVVEDIQISSAAGQRCIAVRIEKQSAGIDVSDLTIRDNYPGDSKVASFVVDQRSDARFVRCTRHQLGQPSPTFLAAGGSVISVESSAPSSMIVTRDGAIAYADDVRSGITNRQPLEKSTGRILPLTRARRLAISPLPGSPQGAQCR